jgi:hypothetical protein
MPLFYHLLFVFSFVANGMMVLTAWMVTPKGKLLTHRLRAWVLWIIRFIFLFTALLAYWAPEFSVSFVTVVLLATISNASQIPYTRALGEEEVYKLEAAAREPFGRGLFFRIFPAVFYGLLAAFVFFFFPISNTWGYWIFFPISNTWGYWIALGIALYALSYLVSRTRGFIRMRRLGRAA